MRRLLLIATVCALLTGALSAGTFTLEQVLSAPFPTELTAAPGGRAVAWIMNERGARNVWYASAPDFRAVRLTSWTADDGQALAQLHFTHDGKALVFVRGGDFEYPAEPDPNPASDPAGVEQDIWMVSPGGQPRKLAQGNSPALSASRLAFLRGGQLWIGSLDGTSQPVQLIPTRAGVTAEDLIWSPDGSRLAFTSNRGNHSLIEVYDFAAKSISYMDPSVDYDSDPVWSADGKTIAFIRVFQGGGEAGRRPKRSSNQPWSIRSASVANGAGRQIWRAEPGPGSVFHSMVADRQLLRAASDRIVFPWEKDGWQHLYSMSMNGGAVAALTPGDFEVEYVSLSEDGKDLIFASNQNDIDRRHIWHVDSAGGSPQPVTGDQGLEWDPVAIAGGYAFLASDARRPAHAVVQVGGEHDLATETVPADFPMTSLVTPQQVIYSSPDGMSIHGQLFLPADLKPGEKRPALIFLHGGSRRQMLLGWHYMDYYNNAYGMNQYLANQGYIVLAINYRSGIGYGLNFREALNYGASGASEFSDVEGAGLYLRGRADVDASRIGLWGGSYGGYLTALGLARASEMFKAGVDFHGVHDWNVEHPVIAPLAGTADAEMERENAAHLAFESSPLASIKTWRSPVLLIHGDDDRNVTFAETVNLVAALRAQGVDFEQLIIPDEIHTFLRHESWLRAYHAAADFLKRKL